MIAKKRKTPLAAVLTSGRAEWRVTSVLRSKTLAQGGFTSPEQIKLPLG